MRGGLGRTLLIAFLLLAIGPLSLVSLYAIDRAEEAATRQQQQQMALLAGAARAQLAAAAHQLEFELGTGRAEPLWALDPTGAPAEGSPPLPPWLPVSRATDSWQVGGTPAELWLAIPTPDGYRAGRLELAEALDSLVLPPALSGASITLERSGERVPLRGEAASEPAEGRAPLAAGWEVVARSPAVGAEGAEGLAAALVAAALLAALVTTVAAAGVTRWITRPLYELTQSAVQIARGNLTRRARVTRANELGVLARAFNVMADRLQESLETLEERVEERTAALQAANAQIEERARRLELFREIGARLGAYDDVARLLDEGSRLVAQVFEFDHVGIWLLERRSGRERELACRAAAGQRPGADGAPCRSVVDHGHGKLAEEGRRVVLPLRLTDQPIGVLELATSEPFADRDVQQFQILADTVAVAIENARASSMEREALDKLRQIEERRTRFLGEMSHELSTALNSIIGFSQLMLKEVDGPLTDMQRTDLTFINRNGTHLLTLLDGMLDVIDAEQPPPARQPTVGEPARD